MIDLTPATTRVAGLLDGVSEEHLSAATPSDDTTVTTLLHHLLGLCTAFRDAAAKLDGPTTNTPPAPVSDPLPAGWREDLAGQLSELGAAWREPTAWEGMTTAGGVTFPAEICGLIALDEVLLHGWELAVATGQGYSPSDAEAQAVLPIVTPTGDPEQDAMREGMFADPVPVPQDASVFDQVLGLSGRDPSWRPSGSA